MWVRGVQRGKWPCGPGTDNNGLNYDSKHENEREADTPEMYVEVESRLV